MATDEEEAEPAGESAGGVAGATEAAAAMAFFLSLVFQ
jgi:hypothetical protein